MDSKNLIEYSKPEVRSKHLLETYGKDFEKDGWIPSYETDDAIHYSKSDFWSDFIIHVLIFIPSAFIGGIITLFMFFINGFLGIMSLLCIFVPNIIYSECSKKNIVLYSKVDDAGKIKIECKNEKSMSGILSAILLGLFTLVMGIFNPVLLLFGALFLIRSLFGREKVVLVYSE